MIQHPDFIPAATARVIRPSSQAGLQSWRDAR